MFLAFQVLLRLTKRGDGQRRGGAGGRRAKPQARCGPVMSERADNWRSTYLARTSVSRLTVSPIARRPSVVAASVCGIKATLKRSAQRFDDRQAHAVDGDRTLGRDLPQQFAVRLKPAGRPFAVVAALGERAEAVDMAGHKMSAETIAERQRAFEIDAAAGPQPAEVRAAERFRAGLKRKPSPSTATTVRQQPLIATLSPIARAFRDDAGGDGSAARPAVPAAEFGDGPQRFDQSGEHARHFRRDSTEPASEELLRKRRSEQRFVFGAAMLEPLPENCAAAESARKPSI